MIVISFSIEAFGEPVTTETISDELVREAIRTRRLHPGIEQIIVEAFEMVMEKETL